MKTHFATSSRSEETEDAPVRLFRLTTHRGSPSSAEPSPDAAYFGPPETARGDIQFRTRR